MLMRDFQLSLAMALLLMLMFAVSAAASTLTPANATVPTVRQSGWPTKTEGRLARAGAEAHPRGDRDVGDATTRRESSEADAVAGAALGGVDP
jgi:hypothetical protein